MITASKTVAVFCLVVFSCAGGLDIDEGERRIWKSCIQTNPISVADLKNLKENFQEPADMSEDVLCFLKCGSELNGVINRDTGEINVDVFLSRPIIRQISNKEKLTECVRTVVVKECADMKKIYACVGEVRA